MLSEVLFLIPFNGICCVFFKSVYYTVVSREENWQESKMKLTVLQFILSASLLFFVHKLWLNKILLEWIEWQAKDTA